MPQTRILIVEDEGIVAVDIERQLLNLGYVPAGIAVTGEEAIALAESARPALVLMDIRLAGHMEGIEAATIIRTRFGIPSVFLTAYATDDMVERAKRAEPLGYLIKPFNEQGLRTTLEIALHKDRLDGQLRESEARYRAIVESARDAIVTMDASGRVMGWSSSARVMFGYSPEEMLGQPIDRFWPEGRRAEYSALFAALVAEGNAGTGEAGLEVVGLHRDGYPVTVEVSVAAWQSAEGRFLTAFLRDTSRRKEAEAMLRLQSAALNAAANGIVITGRDGAIEWVNAAFSSLTGYSFEEAYGRNPRELVKSGAQDLAFYQEMWETILSGAVWEGEITNRRKNGTHYVEQQTITPVRDDTGAISHFIGIKRDLTAQKHLEAQFIQAQKMEVVGRLAGGVAHDFNNLLTVINGTSDLVLRELAEDSPLRADFQQIRDAGDRAERLTQQLLAFSRKQLVSPVVLDISALVTTTAKMLRRLIGEDVHLVVNTDRDAAHVHIDPGHFEQILLNLAVNARDAMPRGGSLIVDTRNAMLDSGFTIMHPEVVPGAFVLLSVTDTGTGIPAAIRERIFEPFFTTKEGGRGTGLGLATVQDIVRRAGGCIVVDSEPGAGATFGVYLPRATATAESSPGSHPGPVRGTETVLVVEDDTGLRELTARMLRGSGYTVLTASGGHHALEVLATHGGPVDLVLTDVVMPGMNGPDLAAELTKGWPGLKVLFTSGYTDDRLSPQLLADGVQFIAKPFTVTTLTRQIRTILDNHPAGT